MSQLIRGAVAEPLGIAPAAQAHAEGNSYSMASYGHAEGYQTTVNGLYGHSEGNNTVAGGTASHAEGLGTNASANYTHAEGNSTTASALHAHAEGVSTTAGGTAAHAEGSTCQASGNNAHAEGSACLATGNNSHAEGSSAKATCVGQHAKASGQFASAGDAQYSNYVAYVSTVGSTPTLLTGSGNGVADTSGTATTSVIVTSSSRAYNFRIDAIARRTDAAGEAAAFSITGGLARDSSGAPRLLGTPTTVKWNDANAAAWTVVPSLVLASGSTYYLAVTVTGEAAKTIRWVATVHTTEAG